MQQLLSNSIKCRPAEMVNSIQVKFLDHHKDYLDQQLSHAWQSLLLIRWKKITYLQIIIR